MMFTWDEYMRKMGFRASFEEDENDFSTHLIPLFNERSRVEEMEIDGLLVCCIFEWLAWLADWAECVGDKMTLAICVMYISLPEN